MIYEFQRQIDISSTHEVSSNNKNNNNYQGNNNSNMSSSKTKKTLTTDDCTSRDEIKVMKKYFQPKLRKTKSTQDILAQNPSIWHTATPWQYNAPKPIRPQLHAFF